jgi:hypothetical protein
MSGRLPGARYDQVSIPGYRQIVDLSPAKGSRFADAVGSRVISSRRITTISCGLAGVRHKKMQNGPRGHRQGRDRLCASCHAERSG